MRIGAYWIHQIWKAFLMEKEKQPIVALNRNQISRPARKFHNRSSLLLSLKKNDLELNLYSSLEPELLREILEKVL